MHEIPLITTIALALSAALLFGLIVRRLGLSPIVGYLIAGVLIGPHTPGVVGDAKIASELAEIGVILLMFGVGLHFSLKDLLAVRWIAVPGALGQSTAATLACAALAVAVGWTWQTGLILGIAVSVASTVVLLRALIDHGVVDTPEGHAAVGWLVVEDIITVLVLVLLPPLAATGGNGAGLWQTIATAVLKLALLTAIMMLAGARFVPWLLLRVARLRSRELFTLTVLVMAICVATISYVAFGASMALGAFLGGMVVGQSKVSDQAAADVLPMRNAFAVLFFVAVGMLFDYRAVLESPMLMLGVLGIILLVKPVAALAIVIIGGHSLKTALTVAGGLAQIGEFSFILGDMAQSLGLMPGKVNNMIVAGAIISIGLNPFVFRRMLALEPVLGRSALLAKWLARRSEKLGARANEIAAERMQRPRRDRRRLRAGRANRHALARGVRNQSHYRRNERRRRPRTSTARKAGAFRRRFATGDPARGAPRRRGLSHRDGAARGDQLADHPGRARSGATGADHHPRRIHQSSGSIRAGRRGYHPLRRSRIRRCAGGSVIARHRRAGGANRRNRQQDPQRTGADPSQLNE